MFPLRIKLTFQTWLYVVFCSQIFYNFKGWKQIQSGKGEEAPGSAPPTKSTLIDAVAMLPMFDNNIVDFPDVSASSLNLTFQLSLRKDQTVHFSTV